MPAVPQVSAAGKKAGELSAVLPEQGVVIPGSSEMVGRYNSLFALDDTLLRMPEQAEQLMKSGIDRLVVNLL